MRAQYRQQIDVNKQSKSSGLGARDRLKGRRISFTNLCKELYHLLDSPVGDCVQSDFRRVLKNLEKNGDPRIEIVRVTSTTPRGLREDDIIIFQ